MWPGPSKSVGLRRSRGFTLLEVLVTAALFSLVIAGIYALYTTMQSTMIRGEMMSDLQQNARVALDQMTRELRMAGYDPQGAIDKVTPPKTAVRAAAPGCLSFVTDFGSGSRQVSYFLRNESTGSDLLDGTCPLTVKCSLRRKEEPWDGSSTFSGGAGAQALAESGNSLAFTYYDANNSVLTPGVATSGCPPGGAVPPSALTFNQLKQVRRVSITLVTRDSRPGIFPEYFTLASHVLLRNQ